MNLRKIVILIIVLLAMPFTMSTIVIADENLTDISPLSIDEIEAVMHPETRHLATDVLRICKEQHISAEFIVSVMRWERRPDLHNWFGWTDSSGKLVKFESDVACLERVIPTIKKNYLSPDGKYFEGYSISAVAKHYNPLSEWEKIIKAEYDRIIEATRKNKSGTIPITINAIKAR